MATNATIEPFNPKLRKFDVWMTMLEALFAHCDITKSDKEKNCFLVSLGGGQTRTVHNALSVSYIIVPHLSINISKFKEHQTWWQRSID
ncbi:hypothetical protein SK128_000072 [Halocaridina rubra]|uniref:Uncharacterized protein n=1 Tax=Halocaridina rubra TaxID=373956 RepID=A0AAN8X340_HALRR